MNKLETLLNEGEKAEDFKWIAAEIEPIFSNDERLQRYHVAIEGDVPPFASQGDADAWMKDVLSSDWGADRFKIPMLVGLLHRPAPWLTKPRWAMELFEGRWVLRCDVFVLLEGTDLL